MTRCLWVVPKAFYPVNDGAKVANLSMLSSMIPYFDEVDLAIFSSEKKDSEKIYLYQNELKIKEVYFVNKTTLLKSNLLKAFKLPITTLPFVNSESLKTIEKILTSKKYDLIVFDGLHPFSAFMDFLNKFGTPFVYRAHNVEADLWQQMGERTKNLILKAIFHWQKNKINKLEELIILKSKKVWCISDEDRKKLSRSLASISENMIHVPVGFNFYQNNQKPSKKKMNSIKLLFVGKMDWQPNKDGLQWFLKNIWPRVNHSQLELHIVGSGNADWGKELFQSINVNFYGALENLDELYRQCDFSIIPIRIGSGTRIKVVESVSQGLPIISTSLGVQGSGLESYLQANNEEEWITTINSLTRTEGERLAKIASNHLAQIYSPQKIGRLAYQSILEN